MNSKELIDNHVTKTIEEFKIAPVTITRHKDRGLATEISSCSCYHSCGSNFSRNGSCSCYTSCGSNYSK